MKTEIAANPSAQPFADVGQSIEVGGDRPFLLSGRDAWYVVSGNVDVFSAAVEGREAVGSRTHRFRAGPGHLLHAVRENGRSVALVAVGTRGTQLLRIGQQHLEQLLRDRNRHPAMASLVDGWVALLCESLAHHLPLEECEELGPGDHLAAEGDQIRSGNGTLWISHRSGGSLILGKPGLEIRGGVPTPLSPDVWLKVLEGGEMQAAVTDEILRRDEVLDGLDRLHQIYLDAIVEQTEEDARQARDQLRSRTAADRRTFEAACARIAETLDTGMVPSTGPAVALDDGIRDPVLEACRVVGAHLGIDVERPSAKDARGSFGDRIGSIAETSRFRTRPVLLRDGWWRKDGGPLVALVKEPARPVALLPISAARYVLEDPASGEREPVTESTAATLEPVAYTLYRPFPERELDFFELLRFGFGGCRRDLTAILLTGAAGGLLGLVTPLAVRSLFNDVIPGAARGELLQIVLMLLVIAVAHTLFNATGALAQARLQGKTGAALQVAIWDRLLSLPVPFFRPYTVGDLASRAMGIESMRQILAGRVMQSLLVGVFSVFHIGLLFIFSTDLAIWAALLIAIAILATLVGGRQQVIAERQVARVRNQLSGAVLQFLSNVAKLRVAGAEIRTFAVWAGKFSQQRQFQFRARSWGNLLESFNAGYPVFASLVIYAMAAPLLLEQEALRTGDFLAFMASFSTALASLLAASAAINLAASAIPYYEQAKPILHSLPEVQLGRTDPGTLKGNIDVHHLSFRYQDDGPMILQEVKLHVHSGEFVALVGPSGSGKSTLLRLLLGFEAPLSGSIYYDGQDLDGLDRQAVRSQIGVVLQNGRLMAGDVFRNIVGSASLTLEDAWEAARMAGLAEDIEAMPMGMHTVISEGGGTFSGGQRQRLMIARALIRRPKLLFFDEATSALDNRTQAIVTESMDRLRTTRIVVAHRLSTIQNADRIFFLERGRVVESGTYQELLELRGKFFELAERQMV